MAEIEVPIASRCFGISFAEDLPVRLQGRVLHYRYQQTIQAVNAIIGSPFVRISSAMASVFIIIVLAIAFAVLYTTQIHSMTIWWIVIVADFIFLGWLIFVQVRLRRQMAAFLAQENISYAQAQLSFNFRRTYCFESPLVIYDFGAASGYQIPVAAAVPVSQAPVYYTNVPQYTTAYTPV